MGKTYGEIDERLQAFIAAQKMFFVATAPLSADGHVNLSPKGYDSFKVLGPRRVAWLDVGGSGIETFAHVRENRRMTIMFCAMSGPANILRLYGHARAVQFGEDGYDDLLKEFPAFDRARNIFDIDVTRIYDSCGWGIPQFEFVGERDQLRRWVDAKDGHDWRRSWIEKNPVSVDGLPGIVAPTEKDN